MITTNYNNSILEINLAYPPCNEIGTQFLADLEKIISDIKKEIYSPKVVLFSSSQESGFSAGADLNELYKSLKNKKKSDCKKKLVSFLNRVHKAFDFFDQAPFGVVGAIHGVCFGGGFELALVCDVLIAQENARFCFPELRLGLIPGFGGIPRLERDVGNAMIRDLLLTGRSINAKKAQEIGLVSQVVAHGRVIAVARSLCEQMSKFEISVMKRSKSFFKPSLKKRLNEEKKVFVEMFMKNNVFSSLETFVLNKGPRPYIL